MAKGKWEAKAQQEKRRSNERTTRVRDEGRGVECCRATCTLVWHGSPDLFAVQYPGSNRNAYAQRSKLARVVQLGERNE